MFWFRERVRSNSSIRCGRVVYNSCCKGGKISIPTFRPRPKPLAFLARFDGDARCNQFMKNIRQYNCLFTFTSMGAKIDRSMNNGRGPTVFKISGQVHHRVGSLIPSDGSPPQFIHLYIYDTANEVRNRLHALHLDERPAEPLDPQIVEEHTQMLDDHNPFVKQFILARDRLADYGDEDFVVRIVGAREGDLVQYNLPTTDQLAMLVVGDFTLDTLNVILSYRLGVVSCSGFLLCTPRLWLCSIPCCFRLESVAFRLALCMMVLTFPTEFRYFGLIPHFCQGVIPNGRSAYVFTSDTNRLQRVGCGSMCGCCVKSFPTGFRCFGPIPHFCQGIILNGRSAYVFASRPLCYTFLDHFHSDMNRLHRVGRGSMCGCRV